MRKNEREDDIHREVKRRASSNQDESKDRNPYAGQYEHAPVSVDEHGDFSPLQLKSSLQIPRSLMEGYIRLYDRHRKAFYSHLHPAERHWTQMNRIQLEPLEEHLQGEGNSEIDVEERYASSADEADIVPQIASSNWTSMELAYFFSSLSRRSRHRPDLISEDLQGSKTPAQVVHYLASLEAASQMHPPRAKERIPAAREVAPQWLQVEELLVKEMGADVHEKAAIQDEWEVLSAALFMQSQMRQKHLTPETGSSGAPGFSQLHSFEELASCLALPRESGGRDRPAKCAPRQAYLRFAETHRVPLPRSIAHYGNGGMSTVRTDGAQATTFFESCRNQFNQGSAIEDFSWSHRIVLQLCEMGILLRLYQGQKSGVEDRCAAESIPFVLTKTVRHQGRSVLFQFRNEGKIIHSRQRHSIPVKKLAQEQLVWADDLTDEMLSNAPTFFCRQVMEAREKLTQATERATLDLLRTICSAELRWLGGAETVKIDPNHQPHAVATLSVGSTSPPGDVIVAKQSSSLVRGRGHKTLTYRGHSLIGMSDVDKARFKARIRMRDQKKESIFEPFRTKLEALPKEQQLKARRRIGKRLKLWGLERTMKAELQCDGGDSQEEEIDASMGSKLAHADKYPSARGPPETPIDSPSLHPGVDSQAYPELGLEEVEDIFTPGLDQKSGHQPEPPIDRPSKSASRPQHDSRATRFRAIGVTRPAAQTILKATVGTELAFDLLNLATLGKIIEANHKTLLTGGRLESDHTSSVVDRIDLATLLPLLYSRVREFTRELIGTILRRFSKSTAVACRGDKLTLFGWHVWIILLDQGLPQCLTDLVSLEGTPSRFGLCEDLAAHVSAARMYREPAVLWTDANGTQTGGQTGDRCAETAAVVTLGRALGWPSSRPDGDVKMRSGVSTALPTRKRTALTEEDNNQQRSVESKWHIHEVACIRALYGLHSPTSSTSARFPVGFWNLPPSRASRKRKLRRETDLMDSAEEEEDDDDDDDGGDRASSALSVSDSGDDDWLVQSDSDPEETLESSESEGKVGRLGLVSPLLPPRRQRQCNCRPRERLAVRSSAFWKRLDRRDRAADDIWAQKEWQRWFADSAELDRLLAVESPSEEGSRAKDDAAGGGSEEGDEQMETESDE